MTHDTFEDYTDGEVHEMYFPTNSPEVDPADNEVYVPDNTDYTPSPFEITGEELEKLTDNEIKEMEEI